MTKLIQALKSRTTLVIVFMFFLGGLQATKGILSAGTYESISGVLSLFAILFHINPSQNYSAPTSMPNGTIIDTAPPTA
jgi:hypothetical protein